MSDMMGKAYSVSIINGRDIDTTTLKLVNKSLVVIGSHTCKATITNLTVEDVY